MRRIFAGIIRLYQRILSPDQGLMSALFPYRFCKYHPTCSEYTRQAILRYGVVKGIYLGFSRLLRCNPFSKGGLDPLR